MALPFFKIKITRDNEPLIKAGADKIEKLDDIFKEFKKKYGDFNK